MNVKFIIGFISIACLSSYMYISTSNETSDTGLSKNHITEKKENKAEIFSNNKNDERKNNPNTNNEITAVPSPEVLDVVVNKKRKFSDGYKPTDLVIPNVKFPFNETVEKKYMRKKAAIALEKLFNLAKQDGIHLNAVSGFRSEQRQEMIYEANVKTKGQEEADKYSAKPGHSEHQTGLVMDVSANSINNKLDTGFANTKEGIWLANNAHRAGFIIRYLQGKENVTGYAYEPWHIRYVGDIAKQIYEERITLEEYLNIK